MPMPVIPVLDDCMDKTETAREMRVSARTLDRWWSERIGPPRIKVGAKVFYRRAAVRAWIEEQEVVPVRSEGQST